MRELGLLFLLLCNLVLCQNTYNKNFIDNACVNANDGHSSLKYILLQEKASFIIKKSIEYLRSTQTTKTILCKEKNKDCITQFEGEWPSYMEMKIMFPYLRGKSKVRDSNLFTTLAIYNSLYEMLLLYPEWYEYVQPVIDRALLNILNYKNGCQFNFWNKLAPNKKLRFRDKKNYQPYVRRPTNFKLKTKFINNAANVTEDADDTSTAYLALWLRKKFNEQHGYQDTLIHHFDDLVYLPYEIFDQYRDTNRNNRHWMNYVYGDEYETGAYLTWLGQEHSFKKWKKWSMFNKLLITLLHNMVFFAPISECFPFAYTPYIPYGANDMCPVVNANVLSCLSAYHFIEQSKGAKSAIQYVSKKIFDGHYDFQGVYYPNRYSLPYYSSEAYYHGLHHFLFDSAMNKLKKDMLELQHPDGYWYSRKIVNNRDTIQSSVYALNALLNIALIQKDYSLLPNITKGIEWLLKQYHRHQNGVYLKGGIFFTGGTVVRLHLCWTSDALTTALSMKAMSKYKYLVENYMACHYEK